MKRNRKTSSVSSFEGLNLDSKLIIVKGGDGDENGEKRPPTPPPPLT